MDARFVTLLVVLLLVARAAVGADAPTLTLGPQPIVLLGEVHDNAIQHALRLRAFEALLAGGARPALLMEQFDRERQDAVDAVLADPASATADRVIAAGSTPSAQWAWDFYRPFVALALAYRLPIVAANVSRDEARRVMTDGLAARGFDADTPADVAAAHAASIVQSHCGQVDATQAARMSLAQSARDQFMARMVERHADRGVLLLAGNGHVRSDVGVPRWLSAGTRERTVAIGLIEDGDDAAGAFDRTVGTPRQSRDDPCAAIGARPVTGR